MCVSGLPPAVDDANPCTLDACDPALGVTHTSCAPLDLTTRYLPVARQIEVPWQDYAHAPDVVLTPLDPQVTVIDLAAAPAYAAAQGSVTTDDDLITEIAGRRIEQGFSLPGGTTLTHGRDAAGRLAEVSFPGGSVTRTYHPTTGKLVGLSGPAGVSLGLTYDGLAKETPAGTATGAADAQDRLLNYGALTFTYQDNGALQSRTNTATGETTLYSYDPLGNLRQVTLPGGSEIEYLVDGLRRRIGKKVNGALVRAWLYRDALQPAAALDASGALVARFVYGERVNVPELTLAQWGAKYDEENI